MTRPRLAMSIDQMLDRSLFPEKTMFFFDFDGVLASQHEEKVYRLAEANRERDILSPRAEQHGIQADLYKVNYLRHLVYQAEYMGMNPLSTLITEFARELDDPYCILTARSGYHAVKRMMNFVDHHGLKPQEIFCMGPSSKAQHLKNMLRIFPEHHFVFLDDSHEHIAQARELEEPRITVIEVVSHHCWKAAELDRQFMLEGFAKGMGSREFRKLYEQEWPVQ